ncbi:MAG: hypothetical protein IJS58_04420 [Bacilli bacterium]|nr:hypothetical protein [Bacilli bacterium]
MLATKINGFLKEYVKRDNKTYTVLFKGKYGCGKTYNINKFFNEYNDEKDNKEKLNYMYLSLFGAKSIDEIVVRLSVRIDSTYIISVDKHYFVPSLPVEKPYNGGIIILDDIDRMSNDVKFEELFGLITSLKMQGFKVLTIVNDEEIIITESYKKNFEKTFDKAFVVTGDSDNVDEILGFDLDKKEGILMVADQNLRLIKKANGIMNEIIEYFSDHKLKPVLGSFENHSLLLRCIIIALRCEYWEEKKGPFFDNEKTFDLNRIRYEIDVSQFNDERIANALYYFFNTKDNVENINLYEDVKLILMALLYGTYDYLIDDEKTEDDIMSVEPFCKTFFYLDDEGKLIFQKEFINCIEKFDFTKKKHMDLLADLIQNPFEQFSKEEIDKISSAFIKCTNVDGKNYLKEFDKYLLFCEDPGKRNRLSSFIKIIEDKNKNIQAMKSNEILEDSIINRDYETLIDILYNNKNKENSKEIAITLSKAKFVLPDLAKTIDYSVWSYCHEIAKFVSQYEDTKKEFLDTLVEQRKKTDSKSLIQRCDALTKYNFNMDFEKYYNDYLEKNNQ